MSMYPGVAFAVTINPPTTIELNPVSSTDFNRNDKCEISTSPTTVGCSTIITSELFVNILHRFITVSESGFETYC